MEERNSRVESRRQRSAAFRLQKRGNREGVGIGRMPAVWRAFLQPKGRAPLKMPQRKAGQRRPVRYTLAIVSELYDLIETAFVWIVIIGAMGLVAYLTFRQVRTMRLRRWRRRHHSHHIHSRIHR